MELVLKIKVNPDMNIHEITDSLNENLRQLAFHGIVDDGDDDGWCWFTPGETVTGRNEEAVNLALAYKVSPVLARKVRGQDCTEDESVLILNYLDVGDGAFRDQVIENFPLEYDQWCSEVNRGDRRPSDRVWDLIPDRVRAAADPGSVEPSPVVSQPTKRGVESFDLSDSEMADFQDSRSLGQYWPASTEGVTEVLNATVGDVNGRSPWVWIRLFNGDLLLATFPSGATYESVSDGVSQTDFDSAASGSLMAWTPKLP